MNAIVRTGPKPIVLVQYVLPDGQIVAYQYRQGQLILPTRTIELQDGRSVLLRLRASARAWTTA